MSRKLIDADIVALEELEYEYHPVYDGKPWYRADDVWKCIEEAPAIDVVRVVRCKDCTEHNHCELEKRLGWYGYCSEGKKK